MLSCTGKWQNNNKTLQLTNIDYLFSCTPDRIRKRCILGRAASDSSSSSGISDDGSSSTHSGSDSGIETASLEDGIQESVQNMSICTNVDKPSLKLTLRMNNSNYEVLRMEGVGNSWKKQRSKTSKKGFRKREISNSSTSSNYKRLKLRLGDETMSTIDLDQI